VTDLHVPAGATRNAFSNMAASETNTQTFINGLIKFMDTYGFDGIDLDWEYPAADDRGGIPADFTNYVSLVKAIRLAFGTKYGLSITLPTSYWYLQHFDLANIQDSVDWFNFMAYDLHGKKPPNLFEPVSSERHKLTSSRYMGCTVNLCWPIYSSSHKHHRD
jgi:GH18 family chitinase